VWAAHVENREKLAAYASAMHQLATRHWQPPSHTDSPLPLTEQQRCCRIRWIVAALRAYFHDGGRNKQRAKDAKRRARYRTLRPDIVEIEEAVETAAAAEDDSCRLSSVGNTDSAMIHLGHDSDEITADIGSVNKSTVLSSDVSTSGITLRQADEVPHLSSDKRTTSDAAPSHGMVISQSMRRSDSAQRVGPQIQVLDVGSCFNPLQEFRFLLYFSQFSVGYEEVLCAAVKWGEKTEQILTKWKKIWRRGVVKKIMIYSSVRTVPTVHVSPARINMVPSFLNCPS
jgi:hypothetical protein